MSKIEVEISPRAYGQIKAGSHWIFANEFVTKMKDLVPGQWVHFFSRGQCVGFGYVNPHSLIAGRLISREPCEDRKTLIFSLIQKSLEKRSALKGYGSYRGVFSESDSLSGLIVDIYEDVVVAQINTWGMDEVKSEIAESLIKLLSPKALIVKADSQIRSLEGAKTYIDVIVGKNEDLENGIVREDQTLFAADFIKGQKTGFFLDQRENRRRLRDQAQGKTILDLCCYSGGWGISALKGGAQSCTFVDQSAEALNLVSKGLKLNGLKESELVESDVFDFLMQHKVKYDVVVCDPPAFVKSKKNLPQALKAYKKLNSLAMERVKEGGILYSCSCSYHLSEGDFENLLKETAEGLQWEAQVDHRGIQPLDHPWVLNRPESRYLKCFALTLRKT